MPDKRQFRDVSPNKPARPLQGIQDWQTDPFNKEMYPSAPGGFYADEESKRRYLEMLARLVSDEAQYRDIVKSWNPDVPDAYAMDPLYDAAYRTRAVGSR